MTSLRVPVCCLWTHQVEQMQPSATSKCSTSIPCLQAQIAMGLCNMYNLKNNDYKVIL